MAIPFKSSITLGQIFAQNDNFRVLAGGTNKLSITDNVTTLSNTHSSSLELTTSAVTLSYNQAKLVLSSGGVYIFQGNPSKNVLYATDSTIGLGYVDRVINIRGSTISINGNYGITGQVLTSNGIAAPTWKDAPGTWVQLRAGGSTWATDESPTFSTLIDTNVNYTNKDFSLLAWKSVETNTWEIMALDNNGSGSWSKSKIYYSHSDNTMRWSSYTMTLSSNGVFSGTRYDFQKFNITRPPDSDNNIRNQYLFGLLK